MAAKDTTTAQLEWPQCDAFLQARGIRFGAPTPGQTVAGSHVNGSLHYLGRARDYGNANSDCNAIAEAFLPLAQGDNAPVAELFYTPLNIFYSGGQQFNPTGALASESQDHVHVGLAVNADLSGAGATGASFAGASANGTVATEQQSASGIGAFFSNIASVGFVERVVKVGFGFVLAVWAVVQVIK